MGSKRFFTVGDLWRHDCKLQVECLVCGHEAALDPFILFQYCAPKVQHVVSVRETRSEQIGNVLARLRCSKCGSKRIDWWPKNRD